MKLSPFNPGPQHVEFPGRDGEWHLFGRGWFRDNSEHVTLKTLECLRCGQHYPQFTGPCGCGFRMEGSQS